MKGRRRQRETGPQRFSMKPNLAGSQSFFGQRPDLGREFGKGSLAAGCAYVFVY